MQVTIESRDPSEAATDLLALPIPALDAEKLRLPARVAALDRALGGRLSAVVEAGDFRGEAGESLTVYPDGDASAKRVLLIGLGPEGGIDGGRVVAQGTPEAIAKRKRSHTGEVLRRELGRL